MGAREDVINERLVRLKGGFSRYVTAYDRLVPFSSEQLTTHRETIDLRRAGGSVRAAVRDPRFVESLRRTLLKWGIGVRASKLVPASEFTQALTVVAPTLERFEGLKIDEPPLPATLADQLWEIIESLGVVENKSKLVAGTKTLHHLLPDLVVPMDNRWTGQFFQLHPPEWTDPINQRRTFRRVYHQFVAIAHHVHPDLYITGQGWRTSRTKIVDNALIGFCKLELGGQPTPATSEFPCVTFDVRGYPPIKNEAKSMLGVGHGQADQVRELLAAAVRACADSAFVPVDQGGVALEVVVRSPIPAPGDATNYLGGIGDVLQDKAKCSIPLDHLGELASVRLYSNDRQIKQVSYREEVGSPTGYTVIVRALPNVQ